jgi:4-hydroxybenzoate polyprenyltransferase
MTEFLKGEKALAAPAPPLAVGFARLKLFLALSRTPHGLLDLATPALAALLWLGGLPPWGVTALGLLTVFAGYTAVYALNDLVDYRVDREKLRLQGGGEQPGYLDAVFRRHPLAAGQVSMKEGLAWTAAWAAVALAGAYRLNPVCALIFLAGCLLEAGYCLLLRVSHLRVLVSGLVKTLGGLAAVLAVDPEPAPGFLLLLCGWLFFWEIGGQNVPADWHDLAADRALAAQTVPVRYGPRGASLIALGALTLSVALSAPLLWLALGHFALLRLGLALGAGLYLLLLPALGLYRTRAKAQAAALFNRASYYPLAILALVFLGLFG